MQNRISQDKVSLNRIKSVLSDYGYKIILDENPNFFYIESEMGLIFLLSVCDDQFHIEIAAKFHFKHDWSYAIRLGLCNTLSNKLVLFNFFINKDDDLICLAFFPYWIFLDVPTFLNFLKRLSHCVHTLNSHTEWSDALRPYSFQSIIPTALRPDVCLPIDVTVDSKTLN